MVEYISKKCIYDIIYNRQKGLQNMGAILVLDAIGKEIRKVPIADVHTVKHGRWIEKPPYKDKTVKGLEFQIVCSECDEQNCSLEFDENYNAIGKTFYKTRYCPNCGARMDLKDGDAE